MGKCHHSISPYSSLHRLPFLQPSLYQNASNMLQLSPINSRYSPHFSQSLSPSPTHGYSPQDDHLRSSSAPVSIPHPSNVMHPNPWLFTAEPSHQNHTCFCHNLHRADLWRSCQLGCLLATLSYGMVLRYTAIWTLDLPPFCLFLSSQFLNSFHTNSIIIT
jgi:hypothetical protein